MGLIQANFGSNMSWVHFGFVSNGFSYKQWPLHSCYRVFRWPRQISFHPKRGHMIWKQQKSKNLGFDAKSSHRHLQIARGQCQISHKRGQHQSKTYPLQKNQGFDSKGFEFQSWLAMVLVQISIGQCQGAKGKLQGAKGRGFQTRYTTNHVKPYQIQSKTMDLDSQGFGLQSWFAMVRL